MNRRRFLSKCLGAAAVMATPVLDMVLQPDSAPITKFRRVSVKWVPKLDRDTCNPLYGIRWGSLYTINKCVLEKFG
jgi:hypothetical protein